jgi:nitrite reductase (NADH) small subunit
MGEAVEWRKVGSLDDIPPRGARRLCQGIGNDPVAVFRTGDGQVFALIDTCPHRGGPLSEGIISDTTVTCPLHEWRIRLEDGCAVAPDEGFARTLPVKVEDGIILVGLPAASPVDA